MSEGIAQPEVLRSSVVLGTVGHWRLVPRAHEFSYPMLILQLDLDELESGRICSLLFRYNSWGICSIRSADYLLGTKTLRQEVQSVLEAHGVSDRPARITLITMPRYFGYVFNPVSFFICFDDQDRVVACLTQVSNTFGETHLYPLVREPSEMPVLWEFPKRFYVSPFFDTEGQYRVTVESEGKELALKVELSKSAGRAFIATLKGRARPLTKRNLFAALLRLPCALLLTIPRIHFQALLIFCKARVSPEPKPTEIEPYTIRVRQNMIHKARLLVLSILREWRGRDKSHV